MRSPYLPIRDALRFLRSGLVAGRDAVAPLGEAAPPPVRVLLRDLVREADRVGRRMERTTARLLAPVFAHAEGQWTLARMMADAGGAAAFADRLYAGMRQAEASLGLPAGQVSELRAARAFTETLEGDPPPEDAFDLAAMLILRAPDDMFAPPAPFAAEAPAAERRLALFAVMLWLLAERLPDAESPQDEEDLLGVAIDAAAALGREIAELPDDRAAIRRLLARYARLI